MCGEAYCPPNAVQNPMLDRSTKSVFGGCKCVFNFISSFLFGWSLCRRPYFFLSIKCISRCKMCFNVKRCVSLRGSFLTKFHQKRT